LGTRAAKFKGLKFRLPNGDTSFLDGNTPLGPSCCDRSRDSATIDKHPIKELLPRRVLGAGGTDAIRYVTQSK
jgi:hypothetical protein